MQSFENAYVECAIWAPSDDEGNPLEVDASELAPETLAKMKEDCREFQENNAALLTRWYELGETEARAGHDFWLTRNHYGAGYWDRWSGNSEAADLGRQLTEAAHAYGSCDLYIGDDGKIYAS